MNSEQHLPELERELLFAKRQGLLSDPLGQTIEQNLALNICEVGSYEEQELRRRIMHHHREQAEAGPLPLPRLAPGQHHIGTDLRGRPVQLTDRHLRDHTLMVGNTGAGKTVMLLVLSMLLIRFCAVWWWDLMKREFSQKIPKLLPQGVRTRVLRARDLRVNPLQAPRGVAPRDWASKGASVIAQALMLPPRSVILLTTAILRVFKKFDVLNGGHLWPTLFDLESEIREMRGANAPARQAVLDRLRLVQDSLGEEVLGWHRAWSTADLARSHTVFDLTDVGPLEQNLILATLLGQEFGARISQGVSNSERGNSLANIVDEAKPLIGSQNSTDGLTDMIALVRGTGIRLVLATQTADIAPSILSNCSLKILGRCGSARDYGTIGSSMGLTSEQNRWASLNLEPGVAIVQTSQGSWRHPFVLRIPLVDAPSSGGQSPAEQTDLGDLADLETIPMRRTSPSVNTSVRETGEGDNSTPIQITDDARRFLRAVVDHPGRPSSSYPGLAGMSNRKAQTLRLELEGHGFIRIHPVQVTARGRSSLIIEPLEPAYRALGLSSEGEQL